MKTIAGKRIPIEAFVKQRSKRFFMQKKKLVLPAVEMLFVWNMFRVLRNDIQLADSVLQQIERAQRNPIGQ
jgi:hypothetical protein